MMFRRKRPRLTYMIRLDHQGMGDDEYIGPFDSEAAIAEFRKTPVGRHPNMDTMGSVVTAESPESFTQGVLKRWRMYGYTDEEIEAS